MMRMIALFALALAAPAIAQDAAPDAMDGYPLEARYTDNSGNFPRDEMARAAAPEVMRDGKGQVQTGAFVELQPGQTLIFRIDAKWQATDIRMADKDSVPARGEIRVSFNSMGGNSSLALLNKSSQAFNYKAVVLKAPGSKDGTTASVCTLIPNVSAYELWSQPIDTLVIGPFTPAPDGEMTCQ